ncbi:hypothetical protein ACWGST_05160 [Agromyces sp. NPDC055520]
MSDDAADAADAALRARIARLQRIAFGAGSAEAERQAAAAELDEVQRAVADAAATRSIGAAGGVTGAGAEGAVDRGGADRGGGAAAGLAPPPVEPLFEPAPELASALARTSARGIRWAIVAGAVALALGIGIGWQLGGRQPAPLVNPAPTPAPTVAAGGSAAPIRRLAAETPMVGVFDRAPVATDALDAATMQLHGLDASSARLLLSQADGLGVFGVRRGDEVCLFVSYSAGTSDGAPACTSGGIGDEGVRTTVARTGAATSVRWRPDGTVELRPNGGRLPPDTADANAAETGVDVSTPGALTQGEYLAAQPVAVQSPAAAVFSRPATAADVPTMDPGTDPLSPLIDLGVGPLEFRLLATRGDGLPVYAARSDSELCLLAEFGAGSSAGTCTTDGRLPFDGLHLSASMSGNSMPSVDVAWHPDGMLTVQTLGG